MTRLFAHGFQVLSPKVSGIDELTQRLHSSSTFSGKQQNASQPLNAFCFDSSWAEGRDPTLRIVETLGARLKTHFGQQLLDAGVFLGTSRGTAVEIERTFLDFQASRTVKPSASPSTTYAASSQMLASAIGSQGISLNVSSTCTSSMHALDCAVQFIHSKSLNSAVVGGVDACATNFVKELLLRAGVHARENLTDEFPCVSFHPRARGMVLGEGGTVFILSNESDFKKLNAHSNLSNLGLEILGTLSKSERGYGRTGISPDAHCLQEVIGELLEKIEIPLESLKVIFAHGSCTKLGDSAEYIAYRSLNLKNVAIHTPKWLFGHQLGASGATSLAYAAQCYAQGWVHESPLKNELLDGVGEAVELRPRDVALVVALGFSGSVSVAALRGL